MKLLDADHPFFAVAWRRWATVLFPGAWALVELLVTGNAGWALIFGAASAYAAWVLLIAPRRKP